MTSRVSALAGAVLTSVVIGMTPTTSYAADFGYGSVKDIPPPPPRSRTWYLKGTIGMSNAAVDDMYNPVYATADFHIGHTDLKSSPIFGIGIGVEHNHWLRFDVTGEYRGSQVFVGQDFNRTFTQPNEFFADVESWVGLANAYIDLGTFRGVTPYVGAGVGFATISVLGLTDENEATNSLFRATDKTQTNFAWALYAGLAYDVTPNFTMDFGYRYIDMGSARSGVVTAYDNSSSYAYHELQDITSHDFLMSARWRLDSPAPTYAFK